MSDIFDVREPKPLAPEGKHPAVPYLVADLGCHRDTYDGVTSIKHRIYIGFELAGTRMEDGRPFVIGKELTVSPSQFDRGGFYFAKTSNAYKMLKSWSNKDKVTSDPTILVKLLGAAHPAFVTVEHVESRTNPGKFNAKIESVKPYKGKETLTRVNEPVDGLSNPDNEKLPEWIMKKVSASLERNGGVPESYYTRQPQPDQDPHNGAEADDPPF